MFGLARPPSAENGVVPLWADLLDRSSVRSAVEGRQISHVFYCTWLRHDTEQENVRFNGGMVANSLPRWTGTRSSTRHW